MAESKEALCQQLAMQQECLEKAEEAAARVQQQVASFPCLLNMNGYENASCTLRWNHREGGSMPELIRLLCEHADTLRHLRVE